MDAAVVVSQSLICSSHKKTYTGSEVVSLVTAADGVGDAGVIGVLHRKGLYDDTDELYIWQVWDGGVFRGGIVKEEE